MDINGLSSLGSALSQAQTGDAVGIAVLKKAMNIQAESAMQLIQATQTSNPAHLGQSVDVRI